MKQNREKNISEDKIEKLTFLFNQGKLLELVKEAKRLISKYPDSIFLWNILGASNVQVRKKCIKEVLNNGKNTNYGYNPCLII